MPWDLQMGESRGAVMDERFNGWGTEAEYVVDYLGCWPTVPSLSLWRGAAAWPPQ